MSVGKDQDASLLSTTFEKVSSSLHILKSVDHFSKSHTDDDAADDTSEIRVKDPALVASDLAAQTAFLRKLKFAYLEQNAKDKYVKTIVSDIDDAPIVTADDNKLLFASNQETKERLKATKERLAATQKQIRELAPHVEQEYSKAENITMQAASLSQKIIDARLQLTRLRQTYPHPRLTVPLADQKLADQVEAMQTLNDDLEDSQRQIHTLKGRVKASASESERLRHERGEVEQAVKEVKERQATDARNERVLIPLYDWYTSSLAFHRSIYGLLEAKSVSDNELRLTYRLDVSPTVDANIVLIFEPTARQLASVQVAVQPENAWHDVLGLPENAFDEVIAIHVQKNDPHGVSVTQSLLERTHLRTSLLRVLLPGYSLHANHGPTEMIVASLPLWMEHVIEDMHIAQYEHANDSAMPSLLDFSLDLDGSPFYFPSEIISRPTSTAIDEQITSAAISRVEYIGSYNWIDNQIPSILVPGFPKQWVVKRMPFTLERDVGVVMADQNNYRSPGRPLLPLVIAVNMKNGMNVETNRPKYDWPSVDVLTDRNSLRKLLRWINAIPGASSDLEFRIDLQLAGEKTVLMNRFSKNERDMASFGFGHNFETATTRAEPGCHEGTHAGHCRISQYDFGGLKMVIRYEVDAYLPHAAQASDVNDLADALAGVSIKATAKSNDATFVSGIAVHPTGSWSIPQTSILEITTRSFWNYQNINWSEVYPQLYLSQTPNLYIGLHQRGAFSRLVQEKLDSPKMKGIHAAEQPKMLMLRWLLGDIQKRLMKRGSDAKISLVCRAGVLGVYERDSYDDCLPEEVLEYFDACKGA
ncbi:hypothetical protein ONZ45_g11066 [Pleurotus djamor]|nr:hypothetical protein ONZ45_g11066 [Pleurotus djamor]